MIRVLWQVPNTPSWVGGLNYFINLYNGLLSLPDRRIEPVILGPVDTLPYPLRNCSFLPYLTPDVNRCSVVSSRWVFRNIHLLYSKIRRKNPNEPFIHYLEKNQISLFSHGYPLGKKSAIPSLCWIPDFQHRHLPEFFSVEEIITRNRGQQYMAEEAQGLIFSSEDAKKDFNRFHPGHSENTFVLHFVASPPHIDEKSVIRVLKKYSIEEPYFHVPNQLWAHKNHSIILDALCILKEKGITPLVISTGQTDDYRNPDYFSNFKQKVIHAGFRERFRFLGLIDYSDANILMRESISFVNPSLFEGWSTTVEEAKSLGKRILLSDIPVHREQAPERADYFNPKEPKELAFLMEKTLKEYDSEAESYARNKAINELPLRMQAFGKQYEEIVFSVIQK